MNTLFIVRSNAAPGREADYNQWYNDVHLKEVLEIEGSQSAQRFELSSAQVQPVQSHGFLAIYEIDGADVAATLARLGEATWLTMSDAIEPESIEISVFAGITDKLSRKAGSKPV